MIVVNDSGRATRSRRSPYRRTAWNIVNVVRYWRHGTFCRTCESIHLQSDLHFWTWWPSRDQGCRWGHLCLIKANLDCATGVNFTLTSNIDWLRRTVDNLFCHHCKVSGVR